TNQTYQGIITIIFVVSAILGIIAFFKRKKPKIEIDFVNANWYKRRPSSQVTSFGITILIHNRGGGNTTIHSATLEIEYGGKIFHMDGGIQNILVESGGSPTKQFTFNLSVDQAVIDKEISKSKIILKHTYGTKETSIPIIKRS
ncbi:MAG: hypothetical protein ACE5RG_10725, partial [Candidatus Nitrosomaritimum yanchengensis]